MTGNSVVRLPTTGEGTYPFNRSIYEFSIQPKLSKMAASMWRRGRIVLAVRASIGSKSRRSSLSPRALH